MDRVMTMDIREDSKALIKGSYLERSIKGYDLIVTNPPFDIAFQIVEKALEDVNEGGFVVMLVRLNTFGGKVRRDFWAEYPAKYAFVHSKRISFTDDGKCDSIEYMRVVWQKGHKPEFTKLMVIG